MTDSFNEKTDYYELLGVEEDVTPDQLKKAYRKAAMKWHPDRNHGNEEEATRVFQLIEHAYSILSDSQERAWYDDHRNFNYDEQGEMVATNVDIYGLFKANAYFGFEDDKHGFFSVFGRAFSSLADEEKLEAPKFGWSNTPYEEVEKFYSFWTCFKTTRSFAFNDMYQLRDAPNAWYRREMSKENQKLRKKAEIEFVNAVRELALYARKRDPRVINEIKRVNELKEQKRIEEEKRKAEKRKKDIEALEKLQEASAKREYSEESLLYLNEFSKDQENDPEWFCDYCGRVMDNENVFKQHCATKKHKKAAATAKRNFMNDPSLFEHTAYVFTLLGLSDYEVQRIDPSVDMTKLVSPNAGKKSRKIKRNASGLDGDNEEEEEVIYEEEEEIEEQPKNKKQQKKNQNQNQKGKKNQKQKDPEDEEEEEEQETQQNKGKKGKKGQQQQQQQKKGGKKNQKQQEPEEDEEEEDDDDAIRRKRALEKPLTKKEKRKLKLQKQQEKKEAKEKAQEEEARQDAPKLSKAEKKYLQKMNERKKFFDYDYDDEEEDAEKKPEEQPKEEEKKDGEKDKEQKDEGAQDASKPEDQKNAKDQKGKKDKKKDNGKPPIQRAKKGVCPPGMFMCRKCRALFPSKRKLFQHLEDTGHATAY